MPAADVGTAATAHPLSSQERDCLDRVHQIRAPRDSGLSQAPDPRHEQIAPRFMHSPRQNFHESSPTTVPRQQTWAGYVRRMRDRLCCSVGVGRPESKISDCHERRENWPALRHVERGPRSKRNPNGGAVAAAVCPLKGICMRQVETGMTSAAGT